jgi:hypothetical protein
MHVPLDLLITFKVMHCAQGKGVVEEGVKVIVWFVVDD